MANVRISSSDVAAGAAAYLVVREGSSWRDIFRLVPGQVMTIGRAATNRIVLRDEVCSRNHCEIFNEGDRWILRDLGSRNGTHVQGVPVHGDWPLEAGQLIRIGGCDLGFTDDLSKPFPDVNSEELPDPDTDTAYDALAVSPLDGHEAEPAIIHRTRATRFGTNSTSSEIVGRDRLNNELARLYRLALEMGAARDGRELANVVLDGLFSGTCADIGAVLLRDSTGPEDVAPGSMYVLSYRTDGDQPYQRVSESLSAIVLESSEAILARDVSDDSRLASRDSLGEIHARSVICAPIRCRERVCGLIHLYSTNPDNPLDPDDLEFTLAVADQMGVAIDNLKEKETLESGLAKARTENQTLRRQLELESRLVGNHERMHQLRETIHRIAPTDATILIRGESGVGKELVARAIHFESNRRNGAFLCMNCAALSEGLLESELFGHEKGSFTGAVGRKIGKFEQADQGTLFLDEVGEMSPAVQAKFLRVLEGHPFERVGGGTSVEVDVRVVAATNRDLEQAVAQGEFRSDLYFRLQVVELFIDPLRDRRSDVALLANFFLERVARKTGRPVKGFSQEALDLLMEYDWPGNVRQLQNTIERAVILTRDDRLQASDIQLSTIGTSERPETPRSPANDDGTLQSLEQLEQDHILSTLEATGWNKSRAAQILGIERSTLDRKLKRYDVSRPGH